MESVELSYLARERASILLVDGDIVLYLRIPERNLDCFSFETLATWNVFFVAFN